MIYTKARLNKAKVHYNELENLNDACAAWGDKDEKFNTGPEKFGVDVDALNMPSASKRYLRFRIEYWDKPLLKKNDPVSRENISEKYRGLVFGDIDNVNKVLYTVSSGHTEYEKGRKVGWTILAEPFYYDRTNLD